MHELVVISGKGGTGKTSLLASIAVLSSNAVIADCDVDAADLHLLLKPDVKEHHEFIGGRVAQILQSKCRGCGECLKLCRFDAIRAYRNGRGERVFSVDPLSCEGCSVCVRFCPACAVDFKARTSGEWFISMTRCGPMVHAKLGVASSNSGKFVSLVRKRSREIAEESNRELLLADGSPGIGCPVIASITGSDAVLLVGEPSLSGLHDLKRVLDLTIHFGIPAFVCVNKWDINKELSEEIEELALSKGAFFAGRVRYDRGVTGAQLEGKTAVETNTPASEDIKKIWDYINTRLKGGRLCA